MAASKDLTIAEKLQAIYDLQQVDSQIDKIQVMKGELPMEVKDLEDDIEGLKTRIGNLENELKEIDDHISAKKNSIKESETLIKKYEKQQNNVKNNREFDALTKEIELQRLEIQLNEKKIKEDGEKKESKVAYLDECKDLAKGKDKDLKTKKVELESIIQDTEKEESKLTKASNKAEKTIQDDRLMNAYRRIRGAYRNGLAVVTVERDSCGGCFAKIPPQRQVEIKQRKKIIVCEHCGRILVFPHQQEAELEKARLEAEKAPKPKRKTTRRRTVAKK